MSPRLGPIKFLTQKKMPLLSPWEMSPKLGPIRLLQVFHSEEDAVFR
jgi:hypothetical protein